MGARETATMRVKAGCVMWAMVLGCTPLQEAPRARQDAGADVARDQGAPDIGVDARVEEDATEVGADVLADRDAADMGLDGGMEPDAMETGVDVAPDRSDAGVAQDVRVTVTGGFVSSAVPSPNLRVTGGFVWQGYVNNNRVEGWLR